MSESRDLSKLDSNILINANKLKVQSHVAPMLSLRYHPFENICGFTNPYYTENNNLTDEELQRHSNHMRSVTDAMHYFFRINPVAIQSQLSPRTVNMDPQSPLISPVISSKRTRKDLEKEIELDHPNLCTIHNRIIHPNLIQSVNQRWQLRVHLLNQNSGVLNAADLSHPYVNEMINANAPVTPRVVTSQN
ncbi:hypothetical protein FG386_000998 [Cryptosporidium ryanae]|uniref:uncharacterized protein n=1 Tax=Cryptosporidium ryanae TaxID=515981 RepID=UPI003519F0A2|nr:hypothetical protein FG386_000998 [Cryptosporidium ryanae]